MDVAVTQGGDDGRYAYDILRCDCLGDQECVLTPSVSNIPLSFKGADFTIDYWPVTHDDSRDKLKSVETTHACNTPSLPFMTSTFWHFEQSATVFSFSGLVSDNFIVCPPHFLFSVAATKHLLSRSATFHTLESKVTPSHGTRTFLIANYHNCWCPSQERLHLCLPHRPPSNSRTLYFSSPINYQTSPSTVTELVPTSETDPTRRKYKPTHLSVLATPT